MTVVVKHLTAGVEFGLRVHIRCQSYKRHVIDLEPERFHKVQQNQCPGSIKKIRLVATDAEDRLRPVLDQPGIGSLCFDPKGKRATSVELRQPPNNFHKGQPRVRLSGVWISRSRVSITVMRAV